VRRSAFIASTFTTAAVLGAPPASASAAAPAAVGIELESVDYGFPVAFLPLRLDGHDVRMAYLDVAPTAAPNGKTLVLLHGKNFYGRYWEATIRAAGARGYRVVAPDQIGWGKSSKPDIAYSFDLLATNTARLLDVLGVLRASIVGHSTGGMLATRFTRMFPDRVERLVLEDSVGMEDYRRVIAPPPLDVLERAELQLDQAGIRRIFTNYLANPARIYLFARAIEIQLGVLQSADYPIWARASALAYRMIYEQPVCYEYDLIATPTLVLAGTADRTAPLAAFAPPAVRSELGHIPELAQRTARAVRDGRYVSIADAGHVPHLEQPATFGDALFGFLAGR
jgi:pimeloyl-ACP methyl ester carboxylesterase